MSDQNQNQSQALTPYQQQRLEVRDRMQAGVAEPMAIVPRTYAELAELCGALAQSTLVPEKMRSRSADIMVILMAGSELGMPPMQALRLHHVIEGVPRLSADGLASVVMRSPLCEFFEPVLSECSDTKAVWRTKRVGRPEQTLTWTIERAVKAKLTGKSTWQAHPGAMLNSRCKSELARLIYPEVVSGMLSAEEAADGEDFREPPTRGQDFEAPPVAPRDPKPAKASGAAPAAAKPKVVEATAVERPTTPTPAAPAAASASPAAPAPTSPTTRDSGDRPPAAAAPPASSPAPSSSPPRSASATPASPPSSPAPSSSSGSGASSADPTPPSSASPPRSATEGPSPDATSSRPTDTASSSAHDDGADDDSGFGGELPEVEEPAQLAEPSSIQQFSGELADLVSEMRTEPELAERTRRLNDLKARWMSWSEARVKQGKEGHADVKRMRTEFTEAVTSLGLRK